MKMAEYDMELRRYLNLSPFEGDEAAGSVYLAASIMEEYDKRASEFVQDCVVLLHDANSSR